MLNINLLPINNAGEMDVVRWMTNRHLEGNCNNLFGEFEQMLNGMTKKEIIDFVKKSDLAHAYYEPRWNKEDIIARILGCLNTSSGMLIMQHITWGKEEDRTWQNIDQWLKERGR